MLCFRQVLIFREQQTGMNGGKCDACYCVRCDRTHEAHLQYYEYVRRLPFGENGWRLIVLILKKDGDAERTIEYL